jgi:branched-chain amino acid transport system permease protein
MVQYDLSFWVAMPIAALASAAAGVIVGLPSLRARGLHLAIVTLATGVAFDRFVFQRSEVISERGSWSFARPSFFGVGLTSDRAWFLVCLAFLLIFMWAATNLRRSKTGRLLSAVQQSELAAGSLGWPVARLKLLGFALSAFVAGWAGALFAGTFEGASSTPFDFRQSITLVAITVIAGVQSVGAVAVAGVFRYVLPRLLGGGAAIDVLTGGLLIVQFLTAPGGIASEIQRLESLFWGVWNKRRRVTETREGLRDVA